MVNMDIFNFPDNLFYTDRHLWARLETNNTLALGIDDLGQHLAGRIVSVRLLREGTQLTIGKVFGTMESLKWVERLSSPVNGTIEESNETVRTQPNLINKDPYNDGWLIKIRVEGKPEEQLANLIHGARIETWKKEELVKYSEQLKEKK